MKDLITIIIKIISSTPSSERPFIISICGAADLGKTYLSNKIVEALHVRSYKASYLGMDAYLVDRNTRNKNGWSGYELKSYRLENIKNDLTQLKAGKEIKVFPYDHAIGKTSKIPKLISPTDFIIFDGLHSMNSLFNPQLSFFICTDDNALIRIRKEADIIKRKYSLEFSNKISEKEFNAYKLNVHPYLNNADYTLFLTSKWDYTLTKNN